MRCESGSGKTWMHTGDVGVMDEEGYISIKDRAKDMLIVSGFKVFSVEVEDKLSALDFIACSALIGRPDEKRPGSEVVNLYVELTSDAKQMDPSDKIRADILEFCQAEMAAYKVPKVIHIIDAIPLTPVGKIDKKVLRAAAPAASNLREASMHKVILVLLLAGFSSCSDGRGTQTRHSESATI